MSKISQPDLIMVLSGENPVERHRSKKAVELYFKYGEQVPILVSGSHSGLLGRTLPEGMKRECHQTRDSIASKNVPSDSIRLEENSLCTLGNFFLSFPHIRSHELEIDLVTDKFHMSRSLWCSNVLFGGTKKFNPQNTENALANPYSIFIESFQKKLLGLDFLIYGVSPGEYDSIFRYMREVHPFYSESTPPFSFYGVFTKIMQNKRLAQRILPTQKQAYSKE